MSGRRRDEDDRAARFGWSDGDVIPLNADEVVQLPEGYDIGPWAYAESEPQPDERWSPDAVAEPPPLPDGGMSGARLEAAVRLLAEWLRERVAEFDGRQVSKEVGEANGYWAARPDGDLDAAIDAMPTMYEDEQAALLEGNTRRLRGDKGCWDGVVACLKTGEASAEFLVAIAALVKNNAFHQRRTSKASVAKSSELRRRRDVYTIILDQKIRDKNQSGRWAKHAIAIEEMRPGEAFDRAVTRIENDITRTEDAGKIEATMERVARCRTAPRPEESFSRS